MSAIQYEKDGKIGILTIKSPPANALSTTILKDLEKSLDTIEEEQDVKAIVLKGEGRFFSAGADIKEFTSLQKASDFTSLSKKGQNLFNRIENFPIPFIAAIHGAALGGGMELALACHMRIVTEKAKLGLPEINLGIIPGFAGTQRLPRYVGSPKAHEMILTGVPISGNEAYEWGLANRVTTEESLLEETMKLAKNIADKGRLAIEQVMKLIPYADGCEFSKGLDAEAEAFAEVFGTEDATEGVQAFIEKRKPVFKDK
ncbi:enoyl-CoA hydratase [Cerasibacillus terrae]|uniref:Enoyl-CoA hydratase n=1 Tax=Cerasibacillus terrae TaxID=2498845 RepID=A0A5C8NNY5_9BACI|nr:enoyl-CoA hydratase [Cerasibacillus terrae]TXL62531.1 enoyl-CoA hydratase [Cerasibacillus terrae]